jgi:hypothetical protein
MKVAIEKITCAKNNCVKVLNISIFEFDFIFWTKTGNVCVLCNIIGKFYLSSLQMMTQSDLKWIFC